MFNSVFPRIILHVCFPRHPKSSKDKSLFNLEMLVKNQNSLGSAFCFIDMQKFPLRMKDNDLLVTELYKDPNEDMVTALSVYLTPKTCKSIILVPPGDSYIKRRACLAEILKKTPKRHQDPVLWAWLEIFSPLSWYQF